MGLQRGTIVDLLNAKRNHPSKSTCYGRKPEPVSYTKPELPLRVEES